MPTDYTWRFFEKRSGGNGAAPPSFERPRATDAAPRQYAGPLNTAAHVNRAGPPRNRVRVFHTVHLDVYSAQLPLPTLPLHSMRDAARSNGHITKTSDGLELLDETKRITAA
jgi:hypothetical protein